MAPRRRRMQSATAEAVLWILIFALVFAGGLVGWIVGDQTGSHGTKTVTVVAGQTQTATVGAGQTQTAATPSGAPPEVTSAAAEFPTPNGDLANTRATHGSIDSGNAKQ